VDIPYSGYTIQKNNQRKKNFEKSRVKEELSLKKIGSLYELLMITLNREDPDPDWSKKDYNLVLTGQKPTLVRGGH
jgi:hypothetical protein